MYPAAKLLPSMTTPVERIVAEAVSRRPDVQNDYAAQNGSLANVRAACVAFMPKFHRKLWTWPRRRRLIRRRSGVGSITDLTLAETQLLDAKNAATDAYTTALSAAATLALATGSLGSAPR